MRTQVITFDSVRFAVIYYIQDGQVQIVDKTSAETRAELTTWLDNQGYPKTGLILWTKPDADPPQGYYLKPYDTDRYLRVYEDNTTEEVDASQFIDPINAVDGF